MTSSSRLVVAAALVTGLAVPGTAMAKHGGDRDRDRDRDRAPAPAATPAPGPARPAAPTPAPAAPAPARLTAAQVCALPTTATQFTYALEGGCALVKVDAADPFDVRYRIGAVGAEPGWSAAVTYTGGGAVSTVGVRFTQRATGRRNEFQLSPGKVVVRGR